MTPCRRFWEHPADDLWTTPCRQSLCRPFFRHAADIKILSAQACFYRLQGVLKNVCREDCLQGVVQRSSAGCFQNNVCELQNFLWDAGCHVCREPSRLTAQTKRSSAGCFLGLVMFSHSCNSCSNRFVRANHFSFTVSFLPGLASICKPPIYSNAPNMYM